MAISQQDIKTRIAQIQAEGGGDTAATRAQIAQEAQQYGVTPEQIGTATGLLGSQVRTMASEAGQAFEPIQPTGGMLGGNNIDLTTPTTPITPRTGMLEGTTVDATPKSYTPTISTSTLQQASAGDYDAFSDFLLGSAMSGQDTKQFRPVVEQIAKQATGDSGTDPAYNFLVTSTALATLKNDYNQAVESGDTTKALELNRAIQSNPDEMYGYYLTQYPEGTAHTTTQQFFNDPFNIGAPGKYQKSFFDEIGDTIGDVVENPFVQAAVTFAYPPAGAVLNAYATLDSGENLTPTQIVAALAGASEISGLEGGNLLKSMPQGVQDFVQSVQDFADGFEGRAVAALKTAFPNVDTEKLAEYEDAIKTTLAGGEDFIKEVVGEENVQAFSEGLAGIEDGFKGLTDIDLSGLGNFLTQEDLTAALAGIQTGGGFTPQRGYQPGLPVDVEFDLPDQSLALQILNQPSSVKPA